MSNKNDKRSRQRMKSARQAYKFVCHARLRVENSWHIISRVRHDAIVLLRKLCQRGLRVRVRVG